MCYVILSVCDDRVSSESDSMLLEETMLCGSDIFLIFRGYSGPLFSGARHDSLQLQTSWLQLGCSATGLGFGINMEVSLSVTGMHSGWWVKEAITCWQYIMSCGPKVRSKQQIILNLIACHSQRKFRRKKTKNLASCKL